MVCSCCKGAFPHSHNRATCPWAEKNGGPRPLNQGQFLQPKKVKKVKKSLEGLDGCMNIFKEPKGLYTPKKVKKPLEGLAGCMNIFKEPKGLYTPKKVKKPLEGLAGCMNIFKEPVVHKTPTSTKICGLCGVAGHNRRTCSHAKCVAELVDATPAELRAAKTLSKFLETPSIRCKTITPFGPEDIHALKPLITFL